MSYLDPQSGEIARLEQRVSDALKVAEDLSHDLAHYYDDARSHLPKAELVVDILAGNDSRVERAREVLYPNAEV
jgi:hypothetical protein